MNVEEYRCRDCSHVFPSHTPIAEEECPRCGGRRLDANPWLLRTGEGTLTTEDYQSLVEART